MDFVETEIKGVFVIKPKVFSDSRGYFMESYKQSEFEKHIGEVKFIQENESKSFYGVLRGLHYQLPPYAQAKLVRVVKGEVLDVAVDMRKDSPTLGKYILEVLNEENKHQLFIPRGFAHGFLVLSDEAIVSYKVDNGYAPQYERCIQYNDPTIGVSWSITPDKIVQSQKDSEAEPFSNATLF